MKWDCGPTHAERHAARRARHEALVAERSKWRSWFAWFPVRVGSHDCRWLETIERRSELKLVFIDYKWVHEYRAPESSENGKDDVAT